MTRTEASQTAAKTRSKTKDELHAETGARYLESASQLLISGSHVIWLDSKTKAVYRDVLLAPTEKTRSQATSGSPELLIDGARLRSPTAIAADGAGKIYVADEGVPAILSWSPDGGVRGIYTGPLLRRPTGIVVIGDRLYVSDAEARSIFSLGLQQEDIAEEFHRTGESFPDKLIYKDGKLFGLDTTSKTLFRFSQVVTKKGEYGPRSTTQTVSSEQSSSEQSSTKTIRLIAITRLGDNTRRLADVALSDNVIFLLEPERRLRLIPLIGGLPVSVDLQNYASAASAIAINEQSIYIADVAVGRIVAMPLILPTNFYFEGGNPSKSIVRFYEYLDDLKLLPLRSYAVTKADAVGISKIVIDEAVLPEYEKNFDSLFCKINNCAKSRGDISLEAGQSILLPDLKVTRYTGRRAVSLPYDKDAFGDQRFVRHAKGKLGNLAKEFVLKDTHKDELEKLLRDLNPSFKGDIMEAETGYFIIPLRSWALQAFAPKADLTAPNSRLSQMLSKNVITVSSSYDVRTQTILVSELDEPGFPAFGMLRESAANGECAKLSEETCAAVNCEKLSERTCKILQMINYVPPPKDGKKPDIGIVDIGFNNAHPEFQDPDGQSALHLYPLSDDQRINVAADDSAEDDKSAFTRIDHGNHIAALIGGRSQQGRMFGMHPSAVMYGIRVGDFKEATNIKPDGNDLSFVHLFNLSIGEREADKAGAGMVGSPLDTIKDYMTVNRGTLFVVAAGNEPGESIPANTLASKGNLDNVIVVGASVTEGSTPAILGGTRSDKDLVGVVAPGENLTSARFGKGYVEMSGTSQATAIVTGVAARLKQIEPDWDPWQIKRRIVSTVDLWTDQNATKVLGGMLNVNKAVLNTRKVLISFNAESGTECVGTIPEMSLTKSFTYLREGVRSNPVYYRNLLRLHLNADNATYTLIYSIPDTNLIKVHTNAVRPNFLLRRVSDVPGDTLVFQGDGSFLFDADEKQATICCPNKSPNGTCPRRKINLQDLKDFINRPDREEPTVNR